METSVATSRRGLMTNAIGLWDSIIVALASSAPTASIALTLAAIVGASHYGGPVAIVVCTLPMLGIALAYRRLNQWRVDCGGSYAWAGLAISPYVGFMVGWIMLLGYFLGSVSDVLPVGPYALQIVAPSLVNTPLAAAISATVALAVITTIAYIGIRVTARFQWLFAAVEYAITITFAVVTFAAVLGGHRGTAPFSWIWLSWNGLGGTTGLSAGILVAVYMFSGWDTAIYINEETRDARQTTGRAAIASVLLLAVLYTFLTLAYQGGVSSARLQENGSNAFAYIVRAVAGPPWDTVMVAAVLLSVIATTQAAIVSGSRIMFAMSGDRTLPPALGKPQPRFHTPGRATLLFAGITAVVLWFYLLGSSSVSATFGTVVSSVGLLFAAFYAMTGIAVAVYYRKLALQRPMGLLTLLVIPLASSAFLIWVIISSIPGQGGWGGPTLRAVYIMLALGVVIMLWARLGERSSFFERPIEAYEPGRTRLDPSPATDQAAPRRRGAP